MDKSQTPNLACPKICTFLFFLLTLTFMIFSNGSHFAYFCVGSLFFDLFITIFIYSGIDQRNFKDYINSMAFLWLKAGSATIVGLVLSGDFSEEGEKYFTFLIVLIFSFWFEVVLLCSKCKKIKVLFEDKSDNQIPIENVNNQPLVS